MEKQGMERRNKIARPGLLGIKAFSAFLCFGFVVFHAPAQSGAVLNNPPTEVRTVVFPLAPFVSENFTITIMVNHPEPSEVTVTPPELPPGLVIERVRSEARIIRDQAGAAASANGEEAPRWTIVEYLLKAGTPLNLELEPFDITVAERRIAAGIIRLNVNYRSGWTLYNPVFRWENPPSALAAGEEAELVLLLSNWNPQIAPPQKIFSGRAPQNTILEELPSGSPASGVNIRYRMRLIPLAADSNAQASVELEAFSFTYEGNILYVPRLNIRLAVQTPVLASQPSINDESQSVESFVETQGFLEVQPEQLFFAEDKQNIPGLFRKEYGRVVGTTKELWHEGSYARALAELRQNERNSFAGPYFVSLRRELEKSLGFSPAGDESWQFWKKIALFLGLVVIFSVILAVFRRIHVTSPGKKGFNYIVSRVCAVILAIVFLCGSVVLVNRSFRSFSSGKRAVLRQTPVYRVPDLKGTQDAYFEEGEAVFIRAIRGNWIYAQSAGNPADRAEGKANGRAGWILKEAAIIY